jgi:site-specific DNA-methyltransferase (adenine-specific)
MLNLPQKPQFCQTDVSGSTFINADCFDVFPFIEDKSIDAIICDLPYGTTACKWDSVLPLDKLWNEYKRVLKPNGVILLTASQPFTTVLIGNDLKMFKYNLVWDKVAVTNPMLAKKQPMRCHEDVLVFYDKQPTYNPQMRVGVKWSRAGKKQHTTDTLGQSTLFNNGSDESEMKYPKSIITFSNADKTKNEHPTQKPIDLMEWLIKTYTNEGDMVLDNTMGSGTTNLACIKLNRKSIGIEKEKQYYDVAVRRASEYCH